VSARKLYLLKIIVCPNPEGSNDFQRFTHGIYPETSGGWGKKIVENQFQGVLLQTLFEKSK
jgi:hypothetical protein